jgi:hypothetical protein
VRRFHVIVPDPTASACDSSAKKKKKKKKHNARRKTKAKQTEVITDERPRFIMNVG